MISEPYTDDVATYMINILYDLIDAKCYPLHAKITHVLFLLWLLLIQQFLTMQDFDLLKLEILEII